MADTFDKESILRTPFETLSHASFKKTSDDKIARRTVQAGSLIDFDWDDFTVDKTDSLKDVYTYTLNAVTVGTIEIRYANSCKDEIVGGGKI